MTEATLNELIRQQDAAVAAARRASVAFAAALELLQEAHKQQSEAIDATLRAAHFVLGGKPQ